VSLISIVIIASIFVSNVVANLPGDSCDDDVDAEGVTHATDYQACVTPSEYVIFGTRNPVLNDD
jgi:hypothetical protein